MKARALTLLSSSLAFVIAACSGGSDSSSSSSSSGTASSSSGGTGETDAGVCTELHLGGKNDPLGGSKTSEVTAQAVSDLSGVATKQVDALKTSCKDFAVALDASSSDQSSADGASDAKAKMTAWCQLASKQLGTVKAQAGGIVSVSSDAPTCKLSVQEKATCQGTCNGAACDVSAKPMTCTGGKLESGFCTGGKLEGGCVDDARCDASCDVTVISFADCPKPTVTVAVNGNGDATAAAKLKAAIEAQLPTVLALHAQLELESNVAATLAGTASSVTDIKPSCIPPLIKATGQASNDVQASFVASSSVIGAAQ